MRGRLRERLRVGRRRSTTAPALDALGAIEAALSYAPAPHEQEWIARIEAARARLEGSDRLVRTLNSDYGIADPEDGIYEENVLSDLCRRASKPQEAGTLLFALVRLLRPERALELGTGVGISAAYQGAALRLNGRGHLVTIEVSAARAEIAREVLSGLSLTDVVDSRRGFFHDLAPDVLRNGVEYAFVDGHHDEKATLNYLNLIEPLLLSPGVVVFDDITWSDGMQRAWAALRTDTRVRASCEAFGMGVCAYR